MTVEIRKEEDENRQLTLTVEVSEDQVQQAMRVKARELSRELRISGFRRGKVPYQVILQRVGTETVRAEAIDDMVQDVFEQALIEADVVPYGRPTLDNMALEPLVLTFTLPLEPVVTFSDYRDLRKEIEAVEIADEAVEEALEQIQTNHQVIESVDRPVQEGDVVSISGRGELAPALDAEESDGEADQDDAESDLEAGDETPDNMVLFEEESIDLLMDPEKLFAGTPFVENLIGKTVGEEVEFSFVFPEGFEEEEFVGREGFFEITVLDVKKRELPALDDELAKLEGDFETLEELREDVRERLEKEAEEQAREELIENTLTDLMTYAELEYPPAAVEMEIDDMVAGFKDQVTRSGWNFEDYLQLQGMTEETLREEFLDDAEERLERRLTLRQFIFDEKVRVETEDVAELVEERVARYDNEELQAQMREFYMSGSGFDMIGNDVLSAKVHERMVAILSGTAPTLAELEAAEESAEESEEE